MTKSDENEELFLAVSHDYLTSSQELKFAISRIRHLAQVIKRNRRDRKREGWVGRGEGEGRNLQDTRNI